MYYINFSLSRQEEETAILTNTLHIGSLSRVTLLFHHLSKKKTEETEFLTNAAVHRKSISYDITYTIKAREETAFLTNAAVYTNYF